LNNLRKEKGTRLHALASEMIKLGVDPTNERQALIQFVLDAMGLGMESEQDYITQTMYLVQPMLLSLTKRPRHFWYLI